MQLLRAFYAFYRALLIRECEHPRVTSSSKQAQAVRFCPDCGYQVRICWTLCRCRTCGSRRHPKKDPEGRVSPLYRYCQHCGQVDYQIIHKNSLSVHEILYAILTKLIDYSEDAGRPATQTSKPRGNPFEIYRGLNIVEGEVLSQEESWSSSR